MGKCVVMSTNLMESVLEQGQSQDRADEFGRPNDRDTGYKSKCERPYLDQHMAPKEAFKEQVVPHIISISCIIIVVCVINWRRIVGYRVSFSTK